MYQTPSRNQPSPVLRIGDPCGVVSHRDWPAVTPGGHRHEAGHQLLLDTASSPDPQPVSRASSGMLT
ncbi:hypothetical protein [Catellatospora chokoriensis]|uniref:hypothetical protein n=1 Tax=Catellatospora chokoriensis TaxID=310353 RepID=UPI0031D0F678